jgi:hypothetical protein
VDEVFGPHKRNVVERAFGQLRQHRAVTARYGKRDFVWRGTVDVASILCRSKIGFWL